MALTDHDGHYDSAARNTAGDDGRDLVNFYTRLTRSVEQACGSKAVADCLARLRTVLLPDEEVSPDRNALSRSFRRVGFSRSECESETFLADFVAKVARAVSRPERQVSLLLRLFVQGDDAAGKAVCGATPQCYICQLTRECDHYNIPRKPEMASRPPAERFMVDNDQALSAQELLGVILFGEKGTGNEELVETLMARYGRLRAIFRADAHEFSGIRGITKPQALRLASIAALHRRLLAEERGAMLKITCARDIYHRYLPELRDYRVEAAVLLMLDPQNNILRDAWFCDGSPTVAHLATADLLRPAVREFASRVALVHNHPSNNPKPSISDIEFTKRLRHACDIIGLSLVDHVIVTESEYYSFAESGMLQP